MKQIKMQYLFKLIFESSKLSKGHHHRGGKSAVFSQYPRPSEYPQENTDLPKLKDIRIMGYSMRTREVRYTEWVRFDPETFTPDFNKVCDRVFYLKFDDVDSVRKLI